MKRIFLCLFPFLLLAACSPVAPSEAAIQTAIAATEEARPTNTPMPTKAPEPTSTPEPTTAPEPTQMPEQATAVSTAVDAPEPVSDRDAGLIYAAAIRQMYSVDHSFDDDPQEFPLVYIVTTTADGTTLFAPPTPPQKLSADLRQSIAAELDDLQFEIIWVESLDEAPLDRVGMVAEGQGIVMTLGNILPQEDGTVQLPFYMLCGPLCVSGKIYVLGEVDGAWQVTGSTGVEVEA